MDFWYRLCCILSKFYIKPQLNPVLILEQSVVSYRNSTSNHNLHLDAGDDVVLYLIEILHQTTTPYFVTLFPKGLYLIEILHQTTTRRRTGRLRCGCILSKFYIKPQHLVTWIFDRAGCILSKFYIKPQPSSLIPLTNWGCILSKFYIKPQRCSRR